MVPSAYISQARVISEEYAQGSVYPARMFRSASTQRRAVAALAAVAASCVAVTGCTGSTGIGPRPVDIRTDTLSPCSVLTPDQLSRFGLEPGHEQSVPAGGGQTERACIWLGRENRSYGVSFPATGVETMVGKPDTEVVKIAGFSAVRGIVHALDAVSPTCQVTIDAAPGRSISVEAQATPAKPAETDELCRSATDIATEVLTTVTPH